MIILNEFILYKKVTHNLEKYYTLIWKDTIGWMTLKIKIYDFLFYDCDACYKC